MERSEVERALDSGKLWARMGNGRYWQCRRNGATKLWKTRPTEFRIPVKAGFRATGAVEHNSNIGTARGADFVISDQQP
jgi:hypothetical protein